MSLLAYRDVVILNDINQEDGASPITSLRTDLLDNTQCR